MSCPDCTWGCFVLQEERKEELMLDFLLGFADHFPYCWKETQEMSLAGDCLRSIVVIPVLLSTTGQPLRTAGQEVSAVYAGLGKA